MQLHRMGIVPSFSPTTNDLMPSNLPSTVQQEIKSTTAQVEEHYHKLLYKVPTLEGEIDQANLVCSHLFVSSRSLYSLTLPFALSPNPV